MHYVRLLVIQSALRQTPHVRLLVIAFSRNAIRHTFGKVFLALILNDAVRLVFYIKRCNFSQVQIFLLKMSTKLENNTFVVKSFNLLLHQIS